MPNGSELAVRVISRLKTSTNLTVLDSVTLDTADQVPDGPYVIYWDADDQQFADRLDGAPNRYNWGCHLICGGTRADQMRWTVAHVRDLVGDWWIDDQLGRLEEQPNGAPEIEDSTIRTDVRNTKTLQYRLTTDWS